MALPKHHGEGAGPDDSRIAVATESTIVVDAGVPAPLMLPSGRFASDASYLQQGDDLLLVGPGGTTVIVRDYFLTDSPPDLMTPEGGRITPEIVNAFTPPEAVGQYAQAGSNTLEAIGQISSMSGKVFVVRTNGVREELGAGDPIYQGDVVETADGAAVDILFIDNTTFALGGDARLAVDKMVYDPDTQEGSSSYSILKGMFVFSSGEIAKINPLDMTVKTTVATIGIRGTTVAGDVKPAGEESKFTIIEGEIIVLTDAGYVVLSEANETTFVTGFDAPPSEAILFSPGEVDGFYGQVKGISNDYYDPDSTRRGDEEGDGEGRAQGPENTGGGEGEGGEPNLDQLADALSDLAPAAGGEGEGEGEGAAFGDQVTLLRVDQNPFRTEAEQQFNLTENAGDEVGGSDGATGGGDDDSGGGDGTAETAAGGEEEDDDGATGEGEGLADSVLVSDFSDRAGGVSFSGSDGVDLIIGSASDDTLSGGAGGDTIRGGDGADTLIGGTGDDTIEGGSGADRIEGGDGDDGLSGGADDDRIEAEDGDDGIAGGEGDDMIDAGSGNDFATGGTGDDTILGGLGDDGIFGDDGNDTIDGGDGADGIDGGSGDDMLSGGGGDDNIVGAAGADTLDGNEGRDTLDGGDGDDLLRGGGDDDEYRIALGAGSDRIEDSGGDGDRAVLTGVSASLAEFGGTSRVGDDLVIALGDDQIVIADHFAGGTIESILFEFEDGSERVLTLSTEETGGGEGGGIIVGTDGSETLSGDDGDDVLIGNGNNDVLVGGGGNDTFLVSGSDDGFDRVSGDSGFDQIIGSDLDDTIGLTIFSGEATVEAIDGGGGENVILGTLDRSTLDFSGTVLTNIARIEGGTGIDTIIGSNGADTIVGGVGNDRLEGRGDDDVFLVSGANDGFDRISGGSGFDQIFGSDEDDTIGLATFTGDTTVEAIEGGGGSNVILGNADRNSFDFSGTVLTNIALIDGGSGNDIITGSAGADTILGGAGNDRLDGGDGDDVFVVSGTNEGFDRVTGGSGFDQIVGSDGNDTIGLTAFAGVETVEAIDGGGGSNVILGNADRNSFDFSGTTLTNIARIDGGGGRDVITGSAGADTIVGGSGNDRLDGGDGDDVFTVSGANDGFDRITGGSGFDQIVGSVGDDTIGLTVFAGDETVEAVDGGDGENVILGNADRNSFDFSGTTLTNIARIDGGGGSDVITGSAGADTILGGSGNDRLHGGAGDDDLRAGAGADQLFGEGGDDRLVIENDGFLLIDGGDGTDTIAFDFALDLTNIPDGRLVGIESFDLRSGGDAALTIGLEDVLAATDGVNALTGGEDDIVIRRDPGDNVNVVGEDWDVSQESIDTDSDGVAESYTVFNDAASGATVYVENLQLA